MEDGEVVGEDAQCELATLRGAGARGERGAESALVLRECALHLRTLSIDVARKRPAHLAAIRRLRPAPTRMHTPIERNRRAGDGEDLPTEHVTVLGVVARVGGHRGEADQPSGLAHGGLEVGRVVRGTDPWDRADDQVRGGVHHRGELRVRRAVVRPRGPAAGVERGIRGAVRRGVHVAVVRARVTRVEPRGIDRGDRGRVGGAADQPCAERPGDDGLLRVAEGPPFSAPARSRCSA
jgi:hypothetical protein